MKRKILLLFFITLSVLSFAQAPTASDNTVSTNEDADKVFVSGDFNFNDGADGDAFLKVQITSLESTGTLFLDSDNDNIVDAGENITNNQEILVTNITKLKFRPNPDDFGASYDSFDFKVADDDEGYSLSDYTMTIDVDAVNDEPSFTKGPNQNVNEDAGVQNVAPWATNLDEGATNENTQTLTFPLSNDNNALFSAQPSVNSSGDLSYTPAPNANGVANVTIYVTDDGGTANGGDNTSPSQNFSITVNALNDPPTAADNTVSVYENNNYIFVVGNFNYSDIESDPLSKVEISTAVGSGTLWIDSDGNGSVNGGESPLAAGNEVPVADINAGNLKFKPVQDENGSPYTSFDFRVHDGTDYSAASYVMTINVNAVNSEPSFVKGPDQNVNEDCGAQTVPAWATSIDPGGSDEGGQTLTFNLSNDNNALFSAQPDVDETTGDLTFTPAADASGVANVDIYLTDDGGTANGGDDTSPTQSFVITVNAQNDPPTAADNTVSVFENNNYVFVAGNFNYSDVESDPFTQIETSTVPGFGTLWIDSDGNGSVNGGESPLAAGNTVSIADINAGNLKFKPVQDENGNPYTSFDFKVHDGTDFSTLSYEMTINVNAVNSEPSFVKGPDQNVNEDCGAQTVPAWATSIDPGGSDEGGQTLTFNLSNDNNALFSAQPDVDETTGDLTFTPAADASGVANVDIYLTDDGGTANGGDDTSPTQSFVITVNAQNDPPVLVNNVLKTVDEGDVGVTIPNTELLVTDVDNTPTEIVFNLTSVPTSGTLKIGAVILNSGDTFTQSDINSGSLNYSHDGSENTTDNFNFSVSDGAGGTLPVTTFNININSVNDPPVFTSTPITTGEEGVLYTYNISVSDPDVPADVITYTVPPPTCPAWLNLVDNGDGTATLSGTPPNGCARNNPIVIEVTDGTDIVQQSYTLIVSLDIIVDAGGGGDYPTIQQGINAAIDGDLVSVLPGTYNENINFNGKDIEVIGNETNPSQVIIDGGATGPCVSFDSGEPSTTVLSGFTLTNGSGRVGLPSTNTLHAPGSGYYGGGVFIFSSDPTLRNLIIENNELQKNNNNGGSGAAIYIGNFSNVTIEGTVSIFQIQNNNSIIYRGGGICIDDSQVTIDNLNINNNSAGNYGGGISLYNSTLNISNTDISGNNVSGKNGSGGGIYSHNSTINPGAGVNVSGNSASVGNNNIHQYP